MRTSTLIKLLPLIMKNHKSQKKILVKILILSFLLLIGCDKNEDTITLIPKDYTGPIKIWFSHDDGTEKKYEDGKRLYVIPANGILKTQFEPQYGYHLPEYYYVKENGEKGKN